jgi:hypothetical protein
LLDSGAASRHLLFMPLLLSGRGRCALLLSMACLAFNCRQPPLLVGHSSAASNKLLFQCRCFQKPLLHFIGVSRAGLELQGSIVGSASARLQLRIAKLLLCNGCRQLALELA